MGLCWIDDSSENILEIANYVFCKLWRTRDHLDLDIKLFGDEYMDYISQCGPNDQIDTEEIKKKIWKKFREVCFAIDRDEWKQSGTTLKQKEPNMAVDCSTISCHDNEVEALIKPWRDEEELSPAGENFPYKEFSQHDKKCDALLKRFKIKQDDVVALDICLLRYDLERCQNRRPILSMALHQRLSKNGYSCYLYSRITVSEEKKKNWKDVYRLIYQEEPPEIYSRFELCSHEDSTDHRALVRMLEEKEGENGVSEHRNTGAKENVD